jgi:hypothetical protein
MRLSWLIGGWVAAWALVIATPCMAGDGVLEINRACAVNTGCFSGDGPGFPVTIDGTAGKSYRLTGELDLTALAETTAISIDAPFVTLDLSGFEIAGPTVCAFDGFGLSCSPTRSSPGIQISARGAAVKNGTVRGISGSGIESTAEGAHIEGIRAVSNAGFGVIVDDDSLVVNSIAIENLNGISVGEDSVVNRCVAKGNQLKGIEGTGPRVVVSASSASDNGLRGFDLDHSSKFVSNTSDSRAGNIRENRCGGGICSERRRYYLTEDQVQGDQALGACAVGFHMASLWEIFAISNLAYDTVLGRGLADSGEGPPSIVTGWIRTGLATTTARNCAAWTSSESGDFGTIAGLNILEGIPSEGLWASAGSGQACFVNDQVWCVED